MSSIETIRDCINRDHGPKAALHPPHLLPAKKKNNDGTVQQRMKFLILGKAGPKYNLKLQYGTGTLGRVGELLWPKFKV